MRSRSLLSLIVVVVATIITGTTGVLSEAQTAFACSCLFPGTAEAIAESDMVFTGSVVSQAGSIQAPRWTFAVDGVVHGDVGPTVEVLGGAIDGAGCGPNFADMDGRITVFADVTDDGLQTWGCLPNPPAAQFESELASLEVPTIDPAGVGPPVAVMAGPQGPYDLSLLDAQGRAVARAHVGADHRSVAHCPGTTRVVLSPRGNLHTVVVIDVATMQAIDERPTEGPGPYLSRDTMACLDGGERVITAIEDQGSPFTFDVTVNNSTGSDTAEVTRRFEDTRRVIFDDAGMVFLLPTGTGGTIRSLSPRDLTPAAGDVVLPDGATAIDADVSPDGRTLGVLTTVIGGDGPKRMTNVITFGLEAGVIDPARTELVPVLPSDAGTDPAGIEPSGFRWVDADTWLIESGTDDDGDRYPPSDRFLTLVATDGSEKTAPVNAGNSVGLVTIDDGVLSSRRDGVELIELEGGATALYPAPKDDDSTNFLGIDLEFDDLTDLPAFAPPTPPNAAIEIKPVDPNATPVTLATTTEVAEASKRSSRVRWAAAAIGVLAAVAIVGSVARSRRRRSNGRHHR